MRSLAIRVIMSEPYEEAVEKTIAALKAEGFGVLTRIDVKATLKEKLGEEFRPYVILGACNPPLAHRALSAEPLVGVMLPCNVTVEQHEQGALVSILNPEMMMGVGALGENPHLREVAGEARARLERAAAALGQVVEG
ncbi:MAG: DUF302 domain-containing protein [Anaerolineae bacterium]